MSQERTILLLLKGQLGELPAEQQALIHQIHGQLKQIVCADNRDEAYFALTLLGAELAAEHA